MHSNLIKPSKSALKHKQAVNNNPYEAPKYPVQVPGAYDQKPYAFVLDSNVQENYSAYRLNSNIARVQSPIVNSARVRQGFYGEKYTPDNPHAGPSANYAISNPNLGTENTIQSPLKGGGSLSKLDTWPDQYSPRPEYPYYHPKPLAQNPQQDQFQRNRYTPNHALIQKNYLGGPPPNMGVATLPSMHDNIPNIPPAFHGYPQPMAIPIPPIIHAHPGRQFRRQNSTEESLFRVEQLMKHNNSHLEKLVKNLDEGPLFYTERHRRDNSLLNSPTKLGQNMFNFNSDYFNNKGDSAKLPDINGKNSPLKSPLRKILDAIEDDSPNSSRTEGFHRKKKDLALNLLEKIIKPTKSDVKSSQALKDLKSADALDKEKNSPGSGKQKNLDDSGEVPSIELKSPMKKKGKKKKKTAKKADSIASIDLEKRKEENKRTLKILLWAMTYPTMLSRSVDKDIIGRKEKYEAKSIKMLQDQRTCLLEFINKHCSNALKNLYKESKTITLVNEDLDAGTAIPDKELKKRFGIIVTRLSAVMEALNSAITPTGFPKSVAEFLADISDKSSVMPPKFLTEFEISCLDISHYGTLKNMNPMRMKLIIGMFVLVKGLIYVFIAQPWTFVPKMKESSSLIKKLKAFSSVIYNVIMDFFRENLQVTRLNQASISPDKRVKSIKNPLSVYTEADDFKKPKPEELLNEVIVGLHTRQELQHCFNLEKDSVVKLKTLVTDCLEKMYVIVEKAQEEKRKTAGLLGIAKNLVT